MEYAGLSRRVGAILIDAIIICFICFALGAIGAILTDSGELEGTHEIIGITEYCGTNVIAVCSAQEGFSNRIYNY